MKLGLYLIRDSKAEAFLSQPIVTPTPGMAERQFRDLLSNENKYFAQHSGDFSLWHVGELDDVSGKVVGCSPSELVTGAQVVACGKEG